MNSESDEEYDAKPKKKKKVAAKSQPKKSIKI